MPIGIGDEIIWICPTLSSTNGADDLSGNGNNGTVVNASLVTDTSNGGTHAYDFQAEDERIEIGRPAELLDQPKNFSISAWVYPTNSSGDRTIWGGYHSLSGGNLYSLFRMDSGSLKYWYTNSGGSFTSSTGPSMTLNTWTHVCITVDNSNVIRFYKNGTLETTNTLSTPSSSPGSSVEWWIGQSQRGLSDTSRDEVFDGMIDDFRWIDRPIATSEVALLASVRGYAVVPPEHPFDSIHVLDS